MRPFCACLVLAPLASRAWHSAEACTPPPIVLCSGGHHLPPDHMLPVPPACAGGIAADEMGLGKTVELMALLLVNR